MFKNNLVTLLFVGIVLAVGALLYQKRQVANVIPPAMPVVAPSPAPVVETAAKPLPETEAMPAQPPTTPPIAAVSELADSAEKQEEFKRNFMEGKLPGMPPDLIKKVEEARLARLKALGSEAGARAELQKLKTCLKEGPSAIPFDKFPVQDENTKKQMEIQVQVACMNTALEYVEKYPSLKKDFQKLVDENASPDSINAYVFSKRPKSK